MAKLNVKLIKSTIGAIPKHKKTIEALGLRKINSVTTHEDNAAIRGMLYHVKHLVEVEEVKE